MQKEKFYTEGSPALKAARLQVCHRPFPELIHSFCAVHVPASGGVCLRHCMNSKGASCMLAALSACMLPKDIGCACARAAKEQIMSA